VQRIELENLTASPDNPQKLVYAGQRNAQEVFMEMVHHLKSVSMLPDEYFLLDDRWEKGAEIPKDAVIFSTVQYGGNEGIYLDVNISWYEDSQKHIKSFATGKTLGESDSHLDRMYLTASAINKALYSNEPHARHVKIGNEEKLSEGAVLHLNNAERQLMIDSLIEIRNNDPPDKNAVEQLLRRVTGSITEFVNEVGARPLQINDYDMTVLAIQDGNQTLFNELMRNNHLPPAEMGGLLICAAARPGKIGFVMTEAILNEAKDLPSEIYLTACQKAISASNTEKVLLMAEKAASCVADLDESLYGKMIGDAIGESKTYIARALVKQCTPAQIQAANPYILAQALYAQDSQLAFSLAEKNINVTHRAADVIRALNFRNNGWMLDYLYERGMEMNPNNTPAMQACISVGSAEMGQVLINRGMDFQRFEQLVADNPGYCEVNETFTALKQHWEVKNPVVQHKPKTLAGKMQAAGEKVKAQDGKPKNKTPKKREERT